MDVVYTTCVLPGDREKQPRKGGGSAYAKQNVHTLTNKGLRERERPIYYLLCLLAKDHTDRTYAHVRVGLRGKMKGLLDTIRGRTRSPPPNSAQQRRMVRVFCPVSVQHSSIGITAG